MSLPNSLEPFRAALEALHRLFAKFGNRGVLIGGVAVGFLGKPRLTEDVDAMFLLSTNALPDFLQGAALSRALPTPKPLLRLIAFCCCAIGPAQRT
jgi:hypothetical protein